MATKFLLETLRLADGGKVLCDVSAPDGRVLLGVIEQTFFEEFSLANPQGMTAQKQARILQDNIGYLEGEAEKQWQAGAQQLVIR
jgi:hypothetical protein